MHQQAGFNERTDVIVFEWVNGQLEINDRVMWNAACALGYVQLLSSHPGAFVPTGVFVVSFKIRTREQWVPAASGPQKRRRIDSKGLYADDDADALNPPAPLPAIPCANNSARIDTSIHGDEYDNVVVIDSDDDNTEPGLNSHADPTSESQDDTAEDEQDKLMREGLDLCEQLSPEMYTWFRQFFMLDDPNCGVDLTDPESSLPIPGMRRKPYLCQVFAAFWMLCTEQTEARGGFVSDVMGIGKTTEILAYFVLSVLLTVNKSEVEHFNQNPNAEDQVGHHIHPDDHQTDTCPSQKRFPFRCACDRRRFSAKDINISPGATLAVVPAALLPVWMDEWAKVIDPVHGGSIGMKLLVGHGASNTKIKELKHQCISTVFEYANDLRPSPDGKHRGGEIKYLVLTTALSYGNHVERPTSLEIIEKSTATRVKGVASIWRANNAKKIVWRALIEDECHLDRGTGGGNNVFYTIVRRQKRQRPVIWLVSGTPYERGPQDIRHWVTRVLTRDEWKEDPTLSYGSSSTFETSAKAVERFQKKAAQAGLNESDKLQYSEEAEKFSKFLQRIMIRRSGGSRWNGKPILRIPSCSHRDIECTIGPDHITELQELEKRSLVQAKDAYQHQLARWLDAGRLGPKPVFEPDNFFRISRRTRILAIFPGLLDVMRNEKMKLNLDCAELWDMLKTPGGDIYARNIDLAISQSSKCSELQSILKEVDSELDYMGRPRKLVILTAFPVVVHILGLVSRSYRFCIWLSNSEM